MEFQGGQGDRESEENDYRPGPVYDTVMKELFRGDPVGACRLLGVAVVGQPKALPAGFTLTTRDVDLLLEVGPGRLIHVEYARRATPELVARMLEYRGLIMKKYPGFHLRQFIVVLGEGTVTGFDDLELNDFALKLGLLYLREADPEQFVWGPNFAPLAMLRRGNPRELERIALRVVEVIRNRGGGRMDALLECAAVLAMVTSDEIMFKNLIEESEMTLESLDHMQLIYKNTRFGKAMRAEARTEGRRQERESVLVALLADRFGENPDLAAAAHRLAGWANLAAAVHAITSARHFDDLVKADPPG